MPDEPETGADGPSVMTGPEKAVLAALVAAWNAFTVLDDAHPDDHDEFRRAIHAAQNIVACRIARRVDPHLWWK